jgi:pyruvate,water dikinase
MLNAYQVGESEIDKIASEIADEIMHTALPAEFSSALKRAYQTLTADSQTGIAVRSSANVEDALEHSFAGQFETILNVTTFEDLVIAFKKVIASNFNARCLSYRKQVGLSLIDFEMAVLCLEMIEATSAGVLFTVDPGSNDAGRMLVSAVPGLGISAVGGEIAADLYYPSRSGPKPDDEAKIVEKSKRIVCVASGGLEEQTIDDSEKRQPLLNGRQLQKRVNYGLIVESHAGHPQDIEWAINRDGEILLLQARPLRIPVQTARVMESLQGKPLLSGGVTACSGRVVGRVKIIRGLADFEHSEAGPHIMVLHQSSVDAARWLSFYSGVIVDVGNPADHLSCVARENSRPMLTGLEKATSTLQDGQLIVLDADRLKVMEAPETIWPEVENSWKSSSAKANQIPASSTEIKELPEMEPLRDLVVQLNLTDAYGPTFNILECRSIHDIVRYVHEMAIISMFDVGDRVLYGGGQLYKLVTSIPFYFQIIDLGGGMVPGLKSSKINLNDIASTPFQALWEGISTPGIRWSGPPPNANIAGLISKSMLDRRSVRPVGCMNYVLLAYDYINLNARMDYHFTMLDSVCSANNRDNYIRFRFKGGGTSQIQRERRSRFIDTILRENNFFTCVNGDMVTGTLSGTSKETIKEKLVMIGRLLGFSRLMDAAMVSDDSPVTVVKAFLDGDYSLEKLPDRGSPISRG